MMRRILQCGVLLVLLSICVLVQAQGERISSYSSDLTLDTNGRVTAREYFIFSSPTVMEGVSKFIPTRTWINDTTRKVVRVQVLDALFDAPSQQYHEVRLAPDGVMVDIGGPEYPQPNARYPFALTYTVDRQVDDFVDKDVLYWEATGAGGWGIPIDAAQVMLHLPSTATGVEVKAFIRSAKAWAPVTTVLPQGNGTYLITAPRTILGQEGLVLEVVLPKGVLQPLSPSSRQLRLVQDNFTAYAGPVTLVLVLAFYLFCWALVGRDPEKGPIMVRAIPPDRLSPASMRFIRQMRYDPKAFAAALVNMGVNGYLVIKETYDRYIIRRVEDGEHTAASKRPIEELTIERTLFKRRREFEFSGENLETIKAVTTDLAKVLNNRCEEIYFNTNQRFLVIGMMLATLALLAMAYWEMPDASLCARLWLMLGAAMLGVGLSLLPYLALHLWQDIFSHKVGWLGNTGLVLKYLCCAAAYVGVGYWLLKPVSPIFWGVLLLLVGLHLLFAHLLKAPTQQGRKMLDQIEGFRYFLIGERQGQLQYQQAAPEKTIELFEQYLPYAIALDAEEEWASQFVETFNGLKRERHLYKPDWYEGEAWDTGSLRRFAQSLDEELAPSLTTLTVPVDAED